jgi:hypothetical protein
MPERLGKYEILGQLGKGGMGVVYKARDPLLERPVALKIMSAELAGDATFKKRFYREARAAAALRHPNIVTIFELGEDQGVPFIAMEYLEGQNLDGIIRANLEIILPRKLAIIRQVCLALQFAHRHGIVHRDVKPANILLMPDGVVKVVDFGIARFGSVTTTQTEHVMGTLNYMSPEQLAGELVDARSDIFSLGTVIYEFLCYRHPFAAPSVPALITKIVTAEPPPLQQHCPDCPAEMSAVVLKCLAKLREKRYPSMDVVLQDFDPIVVHTTQETADRFFQDAQRLANEQQWLQARLYLEQVVALDSSRTPARTLLEHVRAQIEREALRQQLETRVESVREMLRAKHYLEAVTECEAILGLDRSHPQARELLIQARRVLERMRLIEHHWEEAQKLVQEGFFTPAQNEVTKLLELDPTNVEAQVLAQQIQSRSQEREKKRRLVEGLAQAKDLIERGEFLTAENRLEELRKAYPGEPEVMKLYSLARELSARAALARWTQERIQQARQLLDQRQYDRALEILGKARQRNPYDRQLIDMIADIEGKRGFEQAASADETLPLGVPSERATPELVQKGGRPAKEVRPLPETKPAPEERVVPTPAEARAAPAAGTGYPLKGTIQGLTERRTRWPLVLGIVGFVIGLGLAAYVLWPRLFPPPATPPLPTSALTGRVISEAGEPLAGIKVSVRVSQTGQTQVATTTSQGAYRFEDLPPGPCKLTVENPEGFEGQEGSQLTLRGGEVLHQDVRLRRMVVEPAVVAGLVVDERRRPLAQFQVRAVERSTHRETVGLGKKGEYVITGLAPGSYDLKLEPPGAYQPVERTGISLRPGQTLAVNFEARKQAPPAPEFGSIRGRVVEETGKGVGQLSVTVSNPQRHYSKVATTSIDGDFRLVRLPAGIYSVQAESPAGYSSKPLTGIEVAGGQDVSVTLKLEKAAPSLGSIFGRVVDGASRGVPGVQVRVVDQTGTVRTLSSGLNGEYRAANLPAGTYRVTVDPPAGYSCDPLPAMALGAGQDREALTLILKKIPPPPAAVTGIKGTVVDLRGRPLVGATVDVIQPATGVSVRITSTDRDGTFRAAGLSPGTYELSVEHPPIYQAKRISGIKVSAGQEVSIPVTLAAAPR